MKKISTLLYLILISLNIFATWEPSNQRTYVDQRAVYEDFFKKIYQKEIPLVPEKPVLEIGAGIIPMCLPHEYYFVSEQNSSCQENLKTQGYSVLQRPNQSRQANGQKYFSLVVSRNVFDVISYNSSSKNNQLEQIIEKILDQLDVGGKIISFHDLAFYGDIDDVVDLKDNYIKCTLPSNFQTRVLAKMQEFLPDEIKPYFLKANRKEEKFEPNEYSFSHQEFSVKNFNEVLNEALSKIKNQTALSQLKILSYYFIMKEKELFFEKVKDLLQEKYFWEEIYPIFKNTGEMIIESPYEKMISSIKEKFPYLKIETGVKQQTHIVKSLDREKLQRSDIPDDFIKGSLSLIGKHRFLIDVSDSDFFQVEVAVLKISLSVDYKMMGEHYFLRKKYRRSHDAYLQGFQLNQDPTCLSNAALQKIKLEEHSDALELIVKALAEKSKLEDRVVCKCLYRKLQCLKETNADKTHISQTRDELFAHPSFCELRDSMKKKVIEK